MSQEFSRSRSVSSLLFGGTLLGASVAQAGVASFGGATTASSWCAFEVSAYNGATGYSDIFASVSGNPVSGAVSFSAGVYGSASCSEFSSTGVSITAAFTSAAFSGGTSASVTFRQAFTASGDVVMNWSALLPSSGGYLRLDTVGGSGGASPIYWDGSNGALVLSASTAGEHYLLSFASSGPAIEAGTVLNVSFSEVPAPGALALLGAAGLVGGRRRR